MTAGDEKIQNFTIPNYAALMQKHAQREICLVPDTSDIDLFSTSDLFLHKALISFPEDSSAGLDAISPQMLKDLTANSMG